MHIAEGVLSPAQCAVWYAAAAPFVIHGGYRVVKEVKEHPENKLLLATAGAFTFVLSAIKLPSVTGSSSHPTGTGVGAALFKPPVMAFLGMIVLIFQALLLWLFVPQLERWWGTKRFLTFAALTSLAGSVAGTLTRLGCAFRCISTETSTESSSPASVTENGPIRVRRRAVRWPPTPRSSPRSRARARM